VGWLGERWRRPPAREVPASSVRLWQLDPLAAEPPKCWLPPIHRGRAWEVAVAAEVVNSGRLGGGLATVCHLPYPACSWSKFLWLQLQKKKSFYGIRADKGGPLKISNLPLFLGPTLAIRCICQVFLLRNIPCDQSRY
jgi:hypothetical protein